MAGRLTLIQSVTAAIPIYAMQTARLPISLCHQLDKLNRDFLWGDSNNLKRPHLINWDIVCPPKLLGGLGIKKTEDMNQAMLAKAGWRLFRNDDGLWASIYKHKYLHNSNLFNGSYISPKVCSNTWRSTVHGVNLFNQGLFGELVMGKRSTFGLICG